MAFSTLYASIHSALDALKLLPEMEMDVDYQDSIPYLRFGLRVVKLLLLYVRGLGKDAANLESFLLSFEDSVSRIAQEIHRRSLPVSKFNSNIFDFYWSFREDIKKYFSVNFNTLDYNNRRLESSCGLAADELSQLISSLLESLADFINIIPKIKQAIQQVLEALKDQMTVLKSYILFATRTSVEPSKDLLAHAEALSFNAAYIFFTCMATDLDEEEEEAQGRLSEISILLQQIRPIDPWVLEICTQVLSPSKLSRPLLATTAQRFMDDDDDDEAYNAMKNVLDYLISCLFKLLRLNPCHALVSKEADQLQELYQGLRSLRTILKHNPNNFDLNVKQDIGDVLCDAGVLILSSSQVPIQVDLGLLPDLLATIKVIMARVGEQENPQVPTTFNFPITNQLGFVDFVLEKLMELTEPTAETHVQTIQDGLVSLRSFMGNIVELRKEREEVQALWDRVLEVAYKVECLIDHLLIGDLLDYLSTSSDSIIKDIEDIKVDLLEIFPGDTTEIKVKEVSKGYSSRLPSQRPPSFTNEVVGFADEIESIKNKLTGGSKQLRIVAIVGMPGLGKTTLASKVYNDSSVSYYFSVRAWCTISQSLDRRKVLLELLNQTDSNKYSKLLAEPQTTEQDIAQELWKSLKGRRYLIFLDDIWSIEAWNSLTTSFPDDSRGSRIILTSRVHNVAPHHLLFNQQPHYLRQLNNKESLDLLQRKLFPINGWPPALHDLGMQVAKMCKGLPLTIVIVAGLVESKGQEGWKEILDNLGSGLVSSADHCSSILELSYNYLPDYLKPCLLYFGVFREDEEISVRRLLCLWIAEGLVRKAGRTSLDEVAEKYLQDLIGRSLIMVSKTRWDGGVKACRIHDLLRDFCLQKAKEEHFFHFLKGGYDELSAFNEPRNLRRLCIEAEAKHFNKGKLFCPHARTLVFNCPQGKDRYEEMQVGEISSMIHIFKLVRVLDLQQIYLFSGFPSEVTLLLQLAFLAIRGRIKDIPSSIAKLSNLETLIIGRESGSNLETHKMGSEISLPESVWNLHKLKCLEMGWKNWEYFYLPLGEEHCVNYPDLHELETLSSVIIFTGEGSEMSEKLMRKFANIRRLKCGVYVKDDNQKGVQEIVVGEFLSKLESLHIWGYQDMMFEFSLPAHLRKLSLSGFNLSSKNISVIGRLPNLEVVKLEDIIFQGETLEMREGEFSKLRILKLRSEELVRWKAWDVELKCFEKLVLKMCTALEEMPSCFEYNPTLEMIQVFDCSKEVENWARQIEEAQVDLGNSDVKITIQNIFNEEGFDGTCCIL